MMFKRKVMPCLLCGVMVVGLLAGCGEKVDSAGNQDGITTISLAFQYDYEIPKDVIEEYMEKNPDIKIEYRNLVEDDQEMVTKLTGGSFEDVYIIPSVLALSELPNYFAPLGDAKELAEKYYYGDYMNVDGKAYGYPIGVVYEGLLYNQTVLDKYYEGKIPKTLDELYECCRILKENGIIPFYTNAGSEWPIRYWDNLAVTMSDDPDYANTIVETEEPWAEGSYLRQAEDILATLAANGWVEQDVVSADQWDTSVASLGMGETAFILTGSWAIPYVKDAAESLGNDRDSIGFTAFPYKNDVSAENQLNLRVAQDLFIGVNKNAKNLEAAKKFAKYFAENISPYIGENGIQRENGYVQPDVEAVSELDYVNLYTSPAKNPEIAEMGGNCKIDVYQYDAFLLEYVILPSIEAKSPDGAKYNELNELWKTNFK